MSRLKRKSQQDTDDWGLIYSSSSGTDTDSSEDENDDHSKKRSKRNQQPQITMVPFLIQLPHELLCEIFILSSNPVLPLVCRTLAYHLYYCPESVKLQWLLYRHDYNIQAAFYAGVLFPFFTTGLLYRMDAIYHHEQQQQQQQQRQKLIEVKDSDDSDDNNNDDTTIITTINDGDTAASGIMKDNNNNNNTIRIPYTKKKMPPHLFNNTTSTSTITNTRASSNDDMISILLDRGGSPDKPKGYPLIKCAQLGRMDRVQQLVRYGANPTLRNNMALRVCAARNNMDMVLYFLDQLKVTPDSETLRACAQKRLWNMVQVLVDHGAVPDMSTVNFT